MKQESISDEQRDELDKIANALNVPRHTVVRYAVDAFIKENSSVTIDPMRAKFLGSVVLK